MGKKGRARQEANGEHVPKIGRVGKKHGAAATSAAKRKAKRAANKDRSLPAPAQAVAALTAAPEGANALPRRPTGDTSAGALAAPGQPGASRAISPCLSWDLPTLRSRRPRRHRCSCVPSRTRRCSGTRRSRA